MAHRTDPASDGPVKRVSFTARSVAGLKPPAAGQADYWDPAFPQFGLRISDHGRKVWVIRYRSKTGQRRRMTLGVYPHLSLAKARDSARDVLHDVSEGADPAVDKAAERRGETFGDLADDYLTDYAKKQKRSWREDERILETELLPQWKMRKVRDLARRDIRTVIEAIARRPAPIMANRVLALVRKMLNFAIERDWIEANPAAKIPKPGAERARDRMLSPEEIRKIWVAFDTRPPLLRDFCKLRLLTAQRGGELRKMRWADLEFSGKEGEATRSGWWTIPAADAKNRLSHRVPLGSTAAKILDALRPLTGTSEWVFPSRVANQPLHEVKKVVQQIQTDTGIEFRGHDLRRTAASQMASAGIDRLVIAKVLNNAERGATAVYDRHSYDWQKRAALDAWARQLDAILAGKEDGSAKVLGFERAPKKRLPSLRFDAARP
jgi:integrase